jgi:hypothetical protein
MLDFLDWLIVYIELPAILLVLVPLGYTMYKDLS